MSAHFSVGAKLIENFERVSITIARVTTTVVCYRECTHMIAFRSVLAYPKYYRVPRYKINTLLIVVVSSVYYYIIYRWEEDRA